MIFHMILTVHVPISYLNREKIENFLSDYKEMRLLFVFSSLVVALVLSANAPEFNADEIVLMQGAEKGRLTAVKWCVESEGGARFISTEARYQALSRAAMNGHLETVRYLLEAKSGEFSDDQLNFVLSQSEFGNDETSLEVAKYISERVPTCTPNSEALINAAYFGRLGTVRYLLSNSDKFKFSDDQLNSAMLAAKTEEIRLEFDNCLHRDSKLMAEDLD